jgi:methanogenic corrinoid protein MtbC1
MNVAYRSGLSIGALSRASGIPIETLRTWEARYGFPEPERKPSGHRTYPPSTVNRLRRIAEALAHGFRAGQVVGASDDDLNTMLVVVPGPPAEPPARVTVETPPEFDASIAAITAFDGARLQHVLFDAWRRLGPAAFFDEFASPLLRLVGKAWADGQLEIRHEHFLTEQFADVLRALRHPFDERADGPRVVLATLPGERHDLGLQMAALVVAMAGGRVLYLGPDTPIAEIVHLAVECDAGAVAVSVSGSTRGVKSRRDVANLRARLPERMRLACGGEGAPPPMAGVDTIRRLADLSTWTHDLVNG